MSVYAEGGRVLKAVPIGFRKVARTACDKRRLKSYPSVFLFKDNYETN